MLSPTAKARLQASVACVGTYLLWWRFHTTFSAAVAWTAVSLAGLAWLSPRHYRPIQSAFDCLTHVLLTAVTWSVLGLVYFGLFTPVRLWRVLLRQDPIQLRQDKTPATYLQRIRSSGAMRFDRQF